jgi:hypothetical protein
MRLSLAEVYGRFNVFHPESYMALSAYLTWKPSLPFEYLSLEIQYNPSNIFPLETFMPLSTYFFAKGI